MDNYEHLGPGLHRVGPRPFDFAFNPVKGMKVSFTLANGQCVAGTIGDFVQNEDTGELEIELLD